MTSTGNTTPEGDGNVQQLCDSILEAVWDNEIGGTFEPLELMEDLPPGVWLAQSVESPDEWIQACLLVTADGQGLLLDRADNNEWQVKPISDTARRAIQDEGIWPPGRE